MTLHYFASDGNFGNASGMAIVNTANFLEEDWDTIDECYDWEKPAMADKIAKQRNR
jgi:hypothetical protein